MRRKEYSASQWLQKRGLEPARGQANSDTSKFAAEEVNKNEEQTQRLVDFIDDYLLKAGRLGATVDEINLAAAASDLGLGTSSASATVTRQGPLRWIRTHRKGLTSKGKPAEVWIHPSVLCSLDYWTFTGDVKRETSK